MTKRVKRVRAYRSPLREEQARTTRTGICRAAAELFECDGYAATTVASIAKAAGVSPETVYATFGNKADLLRAVLQNTASWDETSIDLLDDGWVTRVRADSDQRRRLASMAKRTRRAQERTAALADMLHIAARGDHELADVEAEFDARRRRDVAGLVELLSEAGPLRLKKREAADVLWAIAVSGLYLRLRRGCGWSGTKAATFVEDLIARVLLP